MIVFETKKNEKVIFEMFCSHMVGIEAVGGKICLTNKRLLFKSHQFNLHNHELEISIKDITSIQRCRLYKYFPGKGVSISLKDDSIEVFSPRNWKKMIEEIEKYVELD